MRDAPSPQVGWGVYKEENPDQFRTPVKEEGPFQWGMDGGDQMGMEMGPGGRQGDFRDRGRGNLRYNGRQGGRFNRRQPNERDNRGGMRGRGWMHQEGGRWNGRGGGPMPPFGRGGNRMPGPMGQNGPMFPFPLGMGLGPGMPMDLNATDPEVIRKEVIPALIKMGEQGRQNGTINEMQFRDLMTQVMEL